jgi:hypothetical protein
MKKGSKVILHMFTGCAIAVKEIIKMDKKSITILANNGNELVFDIKTMKQIEPAPKQERFANYITEDDGSFVPKPRTPRKKKEKIPEVKVEEKKEEIDPETEDWEDEDDFEEDEYIEV